MGQSIAPAVRRTFLLGALLSSSAGVSHAQSAAEKLYKDRCEICHGMDGKGETDMGKKIKVRDFHSPAVQKETDAQLTEIIKKGKNQMPAYENRVPDEQIKQLVQLIRDLQTKK